MAAYFSPAGNEQQSDANGAPVSGALIGTYAAGTTTPITTYTDSAGLVPQTNPIVCNSSGFPSSPIFLPAGQAVKLVFTTSVASGSVAYRPALDNLTGINDPASAGSVTEWTTFTGAATYVSATSFSLAGDQTGTLHIGRRLKTTNTGGIVYSTITASSYSGGTTRTTVTVVNDSGTLDAGLSAVTYGLISFSNTSEPMRNPVVVAASLTGALVDLSPPSGIDRFRVFINAASTNGTNPVCVRIGDASILTSGYVGAVVGAYSAAASAGLPSGAYAILHDVAVAADNYHFVIDFQRISGQTWMISWTGTHYAATRGAYAGMATATLPTGPLQTVRLLMNGGVDTFDAGNAYLVW